jgi:hypothetical protein
MLGEMWKSTIPSHVRRKMSREAGLKRNVGLQNMPELKNYGFFSKK